MCKTDIGWRAGSLAAALVLALGAAPLARAADAPPPAAPSCLQAPFAALQSADLVRHGRTTAAPATMILPADPGARLLFHIPLGADADGRSFRVFETEGSALSSVRGAEVPVINVEAAGAEDDGRFKANDSVALQVAIPPAYPAWALRSFVIVACKGEAFEAWGSVTAPVSHPAVTLAICLGVGLLVYLLGMIAVYAERRKPHVLSAKYPAVFGARALAIGDFLNPIHLMANAFNQGSVQKAQVLLFSFLVGGLVLSLALRTGALVDLSPTVVALLGISGIGAAAAQIAYQQKTRLSFENWAWLHKKGVLQTATPGVDGGPYWRDLVLTNREFDIYKLQTIVFSVAVASALLVGGASHLSSFSVPDALLGILGLSQVVYVGGVLVRPPAVADLDVAITKLRAAGEVLQTARAQATDTDAAGKLMTPPLPDGQAPGTNAQRQYDDLADQVIAMIESALEVPADRSKL